LYDYFSLVVPPENETLHISFGTDADPDRYPWAVAINGNDRDRCGGTLIDDQHVLTAAHCIGTRTTTVSLGSHLYDEGEEFKIDFYCVHNAYSSSNYYRNDLAIIRLAKPAVVQLPKRVATINLCNRSQIINTTISSFAVNLWMVGWGLKNNNIEPDELQEAHVTLADRSMCKGSNRYTDMCVQSRSNTSPMGYID
jgi:secreted trypsin-like serine protease